MTARIAGELPASLVDQAMFAVHRWSRDGLNHRYLRHAVMAGGMVAPRCSVYGAPATWWALAPDELGPELDDTRDRAEDHRACFSDAAPCPIPRDSKRQW
ncbi:hypothetical protein [Amycolatopsis sp. NPDC004079]|uniref:hypothetical protein n=1 Tax=Amycolatopsis sp. NPDC004079 TaxID=3154549 RepID=UPI0033A2F1A0